VLLLCRATVTALSSLKCLHQVESVAQHSLLKRHEPVCGHLDTKHLRRTFEDRLSPQCRAVMAKYRCSNPDDNLIRTDRTGTSRCATARQASQATNPIVVEGPNSAPFIM
jgi:hypothetical protein